MKRPGCRWSSRRRPIAGRAPGPPRHAPCPGRLDPQTHNSWLHPLGRGCAANLCSGHMASNGAWLKGRWRRAGRCGEFWIGGSSRDMASVPEERKKGRLQWTGRPFPTPLLHRWTRSCTISRPGRRSIVTRISPASEQVVRDGSPRPGSATRRWTDHGTQRTLDPGMRRDRPRCPACGGLGRRRGWRRRQMHTTCGPVRVGATLGPVPGLPRELEPHRSDARRAAQQRMSASLQEWLVTLGTLMPFDTATEQLTMLTGIARERRDGAPHHGNGR